MERATPRDFKGVWIPKEIWLSADLTLMEKVLFVGIHSLDNEHGCYASNRHFAEFLGISERQVRTYIGSVKDICRPCWLPSLSRARMRRWDRGCCRTRGRRGAGSGKC